MSENEYRFEWCAVSQIPDIKARWLAVESHSSASFFLSWSWIGQVLSTFNWQPYCLTVYKGRQPVAISLLALLPFKRHGFVRGMGMFLNETGINEQDQIWIEYNDILVVNSEPGLKARCYNYLLSQIKEWGEFSLSGLPKSQLRAIKPDAACHMHIDWQVPTYQVDIKELRARQVDYLSQLSRNTRYQIRRSEKAYLQQGELKLTRAETREQALDMFNAAGEYHLERWGDGEGESGFANPKFIAFHHALIKEAWPKQEVDMLLLHSGARPLAYFYNFIKQGRVYFYLSAVVREASPILKPGLLGHAMAIQNYLERGMLIYDFMGGEARYKKSLAQPGEYLVRLRVQKPGFAYWLERRLKTIKAGLER